MKHSNVIYKRGHNGKGDAWNKIAHELQKQHKMAFKQNGVRDWMRDYLKETDKEKLIHLTQTGITANENGTVNEMHELERCTLDLLEMIDANEVAEQKEKLALEQKGKLETDLRKVATAGLTVSSDVATDAPTTTKPTSSKEILKANAELLKSFTTEMIEIEKQKLTSMNSTNERELAIKESQAATAKVQANAALMAQQNMEKMMILLQQNGTGNNK